MPTKIKLSIIIVEYRSKPQLQKLLAGLPKRADWEVIVVDNNDRNIGYGAGLNEGAKKAHGQYLLFLNPDVEISELSIATMVRYLDAHTNIGLVGPQLLNPDGSVEHSSAEFPTPAVAAVAFSFLNAIFPNNPISRRYWLRDWKRDTTREVDVISGAAIMVRTSAFHNIDGFDQRFFLYWEEFDLCKRMKDVGFSIIYVATAHATHQQGVSMRQAKIDTEDVFHQSRRRYFRKYFGVVKMLALEAWLTTTEQWRLLLVLAVSLFLRLYMLDHSSFIGDLGRDYLQATFLLQLKQFPLLGIPSSIPRFSQGPLNIWFDAISFLLGGLSPYTPPLFSALLTSIGVGMLYALLERKTGKTLAFLAALMLATSPAAISQSRMPFYLFAEPLFLVIYLWQLLCLDRNKNDTVFWAVFSYWLLFQWELATIPLIMLLVVACLRKKISVKSIALYGGFATILGLIPQLIYDALHRCAQLCELFVWSGYRVVATTGFDGRHGLSQQVLLNVATQSINQLTKIVGLNAIELIVVCVIALAGLVVFVARRTRVVPDLYLYALIGSALISLGILLHGDPSEAYFPPFLIFIPILLAYALMWFPRNIARVCIAVSVIFMAVNFITIVEHKYFQESFIRDIHAARWITQESQGRRVALVSYDSAAHFSTYLDGMKFLLLIDGAKSAQSNTPAMFFYVSFEPNTVLPSSVSKIAQFGSTTIGKGSE